MTHRIVCNCCGLPQSDHHDFEPKMPEGCLCNPGEWGDTVNDVCPEFVGEFSICARCEHDRECHKGEK